MAMLIVFLQSCVIYAPPGPMMTYGGPQTTSRGTSDAALALGTGATLFHDGHTPGQGWFGRYKYGLSDKWDLGMDALGVSYSDKYTFTTKIAARYQLFPHFRLEGGVGAADDSNGKSLNSDIGITCGTLRKDKTWNYYGSFRIGYVKGFAGNAIFSSSSSSNDTVAPSDASVALLNLGAQGRVSDRINFIFEGGYGYIFPVGHQSGKTLYLSCGLLFNLGKPH